MKLLYIILSIIILLGAINIIMNWDKLEWIIKL